MVPYLLSSLILATAHPSLQSEKEATLLTSFINPTSLVPSVPCLLHLPPLCSFLSPVHIHLYILSYVNKLGNLMPFFLNKTQQMLFPRPVLSSCTHISGGTYSVTHLF